ncbi:MAG: flavin monoamine oxidase family protein [Flavobacterium sp.]
MSASSQEILVLGGGAAGLMAAFTLARAGKTVTVLEARDRVGGRIHTVCQSFTEPTELGAEFIHGNLPLTLQLLKQAGIQKHPVDFEMWHFKDGSLVQSHEFIENWDDLLEKLNSLEQDMPMSTFLERYFSGEAFMPMRQQIADYVSGYDTANITDASCFALRREWNNESDSDQYRIEGGYASLINYLTTEFHKMGGIILTNTQVKNIHWQKGSVEIKTIGGEVFTSGKVVVALPLGILQLNPENAGCINFYPEISVQRSAFNNIGFGQVVKILLEFNSVFWEKELLAPAAGQDISGMGFLFTNREIPTFWTQAPLKRPLLTGWLGGPPALAVKDFSKEEVLNLALRSLEAVFDISVRQLHEHVTAWDVVNWANEPYTRGSYAYDKVDSAHARSVLFEPIEATIYFAGEYLYEGPAMGTVEAALTSGKRAAEKLLGLYMD